MKFYEKDWFVILMLILFFPAGLFLIWKYSKWPRVAKIIVTIVIAILAVLSNVQTEYKNALKTAKSYDKTLYMSKQGLYDQLTSEFEQFTPEAAQHAVDNVGANWKENALKTAESYQKLANMSSNDIYDQLTSKWEQFTPEEAQYAIDNLK